MARTLAADRIPAPPHRLPWGTALRAGLLTFVASSLLVSLLIGSYWAAQTNFPGHEHPEGTAEHLHTLQDVLGAVSGPVVVLVLGLVVAVASSVPLLAGWLADRKLRGPNLGRGPPLLARLPASAPSPT